MTKILKISKSGYYKYKKAVVKEDKIEKIIEIIFNDNRRVYGTRKIKVELAKLGYQVSRRKISRIMHELGLESVYTHKKYRNYNQKTNNSIKPNLIERDFNNRKEYEVIVSDLTYVRVLNNWNYVCIILDLYAREIIGYSCGKHKDSKLVYQAFSKIKANLRKYIYFHTDRGSEHTGNIIDGLLKEFQIERSLSKKGNPYDNAVAEATFKIIKKELIQNKIYQNISELEKELAAYVYWFNNKRIHSTLNYLSPVEYKQLSL